MMAQINPLPLSFAEPVCLAPAGVLREWCEQRGWSKSGSPTTTRENLLLPILVFGILYTSLWRVRAVSFPPRSFFGISDFIYARLMPSGRSLRHLVVRNDRPRWSSTFRLFFFSLRASTTRAHAVRRSACFMFQIRCSMISVRCSH